MTRTISLITATVGAALLFAVPANADNWGAEKAQPIDQRSEALNKQYGLGEYAPVDMRSEGLNRHYGLGEYASSVDARERALGTKAELQMASDFYADGFAQAVRPDVASGPVRDDRFNLNPQDVPAPVATTSSGREIDWPQVGIALGIGLLLALGLFVAVRTRIRPVAH